MHSLDMLLHMPKILLLEDFVKKKWNAEIYFEKGIRMGLFDFLSAFSSGTSLKVATKSAPNSMGCYKIFLNGSLKYVGKAEDGIRKRFVQYYNGTTAHYPSAQKIYEHRDEISVALVVLQSRQECRNTEAEWIDRYQPPWNERSGWGD